MKLVSVSISCHVGGVLLGTIEKGYLHIEKVKTKNGKY